eukprot:COSAG02_NODE_11618_length_1688_cov_2.582127_1_plen_198_part_00
MVGLGLGLGLRCAVGRTNGAAMAHRFATALLCHAAGACCWVDEECLAALVAHGAFAHAPMRHRRRRRCRRALRCYARFARRSIHAVEAARRARRAAAVVSRTDRRRHILRQHGAHHARADRSEAQPSTHLARRSAAPASSTDSPAPQLCQRDSAIQRETARDRAMQRATAPAPAPAPAAPGLPDVLESFSSTLIFSG